MRSPLSSCARGSKASCRRSSRRTPSIRRGCWRARWGRVGGSWSACRAVGTRTWTRSKSPRSPRLRRDFAEAPVMVAEATRLERALKVSGDLTLVAYIMAGHPNKKKSIEVGKKLAASGIAAIEIGIPFSDPLADGPVIQRAGHVALENGMNITGARKELPAGMKELFALVRKHTNLPIAAGFGISRPEHMKALRGTADAAVVGRAIVHEIDRGGDPVPLVKELLKACR